MVRTFPFPHQKNYYIKQSPCNTLLFINANNKLSQWTMCILFLQGRIQGGELASDHIELQFKELERKC